MSKLYIKDGRVIDPASGVGATLGLTTDRERITWLGKGSPPRGDYEVIDAKGAVVCPGFIDLHCHLRQPGFEEKETIRTGTLAAARGGFTTVCCMPNTNPPLDSADSISYAKSIAASEASIRVLPIGCISKGRRGEELTEMAELTSAGAIGFSDDGSPVRSPRIMRNALEYSLGLGLPIIEHCEELELSQGGQMHEGIVATRLGLPGIPAAAEETAVARDIALARLTGARLHIAHVSTKGAVAQIRLAKRDGTRITAEVTPHHLTLTEDNLLGYDTMAKVNPPLRTQADVEALIKGLKDGTIDAVATDHAPHTEADKDCEFELAASGISGLETALGCLMGLVHSGRLPLGLLIAKLTAAPAAIIGERAGKLGTLAVGGNADITIFDPDAEWTVDPTQFASKGRNTPLRGKHLKGKVMMTIYNGKVVYRSEGWGD